MSSSLLGPFGIVVFAVTCFAGCADPQTADECFDLALERFNRKDYSSALRLCDRAVELEPDSSSGYNMRALVHQAQGDLQESIADWTRAIELAPDDATKSFMYTCRSWVYHEMGDQMSRAEDLVEAGKLKRQLD